MNGDIQTTDGTVLQSHEAGRWYSVEIRYQRVGTNLTLTYWIDGTKYGSYTVTVDVGFEEALDHLQLAAQEGSAYFDNIEVTAAP